MTNTTTTLAQLKEAKDNSWELISCLTREQVDKTAPEEYAAAKAQWMKATADYYYAFNHNTEMA